MNKETRFPNVLSWTTAILTVLVILMGSIRVLITPVFARIQYQLPGFPDDPFGFTIEDRLHWSEPSIRYLVNAEGIDYLANLEFEDGEPIYNQRELRHMEDVKFVVTGMRIGLAATVVMMVIITIIAVRNHWKEKIIQGIARGAWGLLGLIGAILLFLMLNFNKLFTWFHMIFFESGTWLFYQSDTLIRLFPLTFWQNAFITVGLLCIIIAVILLLLCRKNNPIELNR